uniref:Uncharacterized protein n=1 Tax=Strongyloides venezuelensis TaxID=75913 RepID=A0A0K0FCI6_STRVS
MKEVAVEALRISKRPRNNIEMRNVISEDITTNSKAPVALSTVEANDQLLKGVKDTIRNEIKNSLDAFITIK